jgi:hypothetical protein
MKYFPSFNIVKAKEIVKGMNVKSLKDYKEKLRLENPYNLPFKPKRAYSKEWIDNLDYFGESYRSSNYKKS